MDAPSPELAPPTAEPPWANARDEELLAMRVCDLGVRIEGSELKALELRQVLEVEGGTPEHCMQLLRHECGHAIDHAYRFSRRRRWRQLFGNTDNEATPDIYRPRPYSKSFVRHLPNWYAQAHPDEDFAETFAVWLTYPADEWRAQYPGWE